MIWGYPLFWNLKTEPKISMLSAVEIDGRMTSKRFFLKFEKNLNVKKVQNWFFLKKIKFRSFLKNLYSWNIKQKRSGNLWKEKQYVSPLAAKLSWGSLLERILDLDVGFTTPKIVYNLNHKYILT